MRLKARAFTPPGPVPYKGAFAGLAPKEQRSEKQRKELLTLKAEELIAEVEQLEAEAGEPALREAIGMAIAAQGLDSKDMATAWDPTKSGKISRGECRLHLKRLLSGQNEPNVKDIDGVFDAYDLDRSGVIDLLELQSMINELMQAGTAFEKKQGAALQERRAKVSWLRELATLVTQAESLMAQAERKESEAQAFQVQLAADLEAQLGLACARRRVKAADFVGQYAGSPSGMTKSEFSTMVHSLLPAAQPSEAEALFDRVDRDLSGFLDLKEATAGVLG